MTILQTRKAVLNVNDIRRVKYNSGEHVVIPVVMIVDGVLNDALVTHEEYGKVVDAWNDKPVTVNHPEVNGEFVSAGSPDIIEKLSIGRVYNASVDGDKLVAELWLDPEKADRIGRTDLLKALEGGAVVEVSTGYFSTRHDIQGEFNGKTYLYIDENIVPDHLALLPADEGACSVADGCGTRKPNVFLRIAGALGLRTNCNNEDDCTMCTKAELKAKLQGNAALSAEQIEALMELDEKALSAVQALAGALGSMGGAAPSDNTDEEEMPEANAGEEEEVMPMKSNVTLDQVAKLIQDAFVANATAPIVERIKANSANVLSEAALKAMGRDDLEKYEQSIRPVDYAGFGGPVVANAGSNVAPLLPPRGLVARIKEFK
jgi:hypothetical protein